MKGMKKKLKEELPAVFSDKRKRENKDRDELEDELEKPILDALARRLESFGSFESIRDKVKEALKVQTGPDILTASTVERKLEQIDKAARNWESAIDRGLNVDPRKKRVRVGFYRLPTRAVPLTDIDYEEVTINGGGMREKMKCEGYRN